MANEEYEQAMRYLIFNAHPTEEELPHVMEGLVAVHLNLAATKLRTGREKEAIAEANKASRSSSSSPLVARALCTSGHLSQVLELVPKQPKALYRIGQAHLQLGHYADAKRFLEKSMAASVGDAEAVKSVSYLMRRIRDR